MSGENKNQRMASYASSKAAANHLTRNIAFDLGPMGIRVNAEALSRQLSLRGVSHWASQPFHQSLLQGELPQTAGGGIGQSRLCMFFLKRSRLF